MSGNTLIRAEVIATEAARMLGRECQAHIEHSVLYLRSSVPGIGGVACNVKLEPMALTMTMQNFTERYIAPCVAAMQQERSTP